MPGMASWSWVTAMHNSQLARNGSWSRDRQATDHGGGENGEEGESVSGQTLNLSPVRWCEGPALVSGDKIGLCGHNIFMASPVLKAWGDSWGR